MNPHVAPVSFDFMIDDHSSSESSRWSDMLPPSSLHRIGSEAAHPDEESSGAEVNCHFFRHRHPLAVSSAFKFPRRKLSRKSINTDSCCPAGGKVTLEKAVYSSGNAKRHEESTTYGSDSCSSQKVKVSFGNESVHILENIGTWSGQNFFESWYTREECRDFSDAVDEICYVLRTCSVAEAEARGHCIRGIEYCISTASREKRQKLIRAAKISVFSIQDKFDRLRECEAELLKDSARAHNYDSDDEYEFYTKEDEALTIASAYASVSADSLDQAHRMGLLDERVGKSQLKQDATPRPACRKFSVV